MGFIDNIKESFSSSELPIEPVYRAAIFGDYSAYFENVSGIVSYQPTEIKLALKKGGLTIKGEKLYVKKYCMGDLSLCGKITSIERTL